MTSVEVVLDAGPIPYRAIALYGDPDLEHGLRHAGFEPAATMYRLIQIPLGAIAEVRSMPWKHPHEAYVEHVRSGDAFPPIVVMPVRSGWTLLDGVNRTYAYWVAGRETVVAYDLVSARTNPCTAR